MFVLTALVDTSGADLTGLESSNASNIRTNMKFFLRLHLNSRTALLERVCVMISYTYDMCNGWFTRFLRSPENC